MTEESGTSALGASGNTAPKHPALAEHPRITNPYYHLIKVLKNGLQPAVQALDLPAGSHVLDYGCSTMRHRGMFPANIKYTGADIAGNDLADVILNKDGRVPLASGSFDVVFSTQVLEHVEDPLLYLSECQRLLKPGGKLVLSTHGTFMFHACPNDYWRWTHMGLQKIVENAGFRVTSLQGLCGGLPTALQLLQDVIRLKLPRFLRPVLYAIIQSGMALTDRMYSPEGRIRNATFLLVTAQLPQLKAPDAAPATNAA